MWKSKTLKMGVWEITIKEGVDKDTVKLDITHPEKPMMATIYSNKDSLFIINPDGDLVII